MKSEKIEVERTGWGSTVSEVEYCEDFAEMFATDNEDGDPFDVVPQKTVAESMEAYDRSFGNLGNVYGVDGPKKDLERGNVVEATVVSVSVDGGQTQLETGTMSIVYVNTQRENRFLESIGQTDLEPGMKVNVLIEDVDKKAGYFLGSIEGALMRLNRAELRGALRSNDSAYEGIIKSTNDGGFIVTVGGIDCFMPGSLAAANRISNFDQYIGKRVKVMVESYLENSDMFVVSVKKYIQKILPGEIQKLDMMLERTGRVTGVTDFGVFVEWEDIFTGLLHGSEALDGWQDLRTGEEVTFHIKEIRDTRIVLTQNGPNEDYLKYAAFKEAHEGSVTHGFVSLIAENEYRRVLGAEVEVEGLTGFLPFAQMKRMKRIKEGDLIDVQIGSVDVQSRRILLRSPE